MSNTSDSLRTVVINDVAMDISTNPYVKVTSDDKLYELLLSYIGSHSLDARSYAAASTGAARNNYDSESDDEEGKGPASDNHRIHMKIGFGSYRFRDHRGAEVYAIHEYIGQPVGTNCGAVLYTSLTIIAKDGSLEDLKSFFTELIIESEKTKKGLVKIYSWDIRRYYWRTRSSIRARNLDSVILPQKTKAKIVNDVSHFLGPKAKDFYGSHGIPYRRSYLLHGVPGAGKTSFIQAIASHFNRSISYLQPTHPDMTDDSLASAMSELPSNTVVVLEDIDALFGKDRSSKVQKSNLTFSGLLNALDGIGSNSGQLIFLTTNLRDQLDPALIRNGRVDFHVHFDYATDEQIQEMWRSFYPDDTSLAERFCSDLRTKLEGKPIATAGLQHFFVLHMASSAEEAVSNIDVIIEDMKQKEVDANPSTVLGPDNAILEEASRESASTDAASEESAASSAKVKPGDEATTSHDIHIYIHSDVGKVKVTTV